MFLVNPIRFRLVIRHPLLGRRGSHIVRPESLSERLVAVLRAAEQPVLEGHQHEGLQGVLRDENLVLPVHQGGGIGAGVVIVLRDELVLRLQDLLQRDERVDDLPEQAFLLCGTIDEVIAKRGEFA